MFYLISTLIFFASPVMAESIELIGGGPAKEGEFPSSVYVSLDGARCSGTVVGPTALLLAAHCIGKSKAASFQLSGVKYQGRCTVHKGWANNETADWALCKMNKEIEGISFEKVNTDPSAVAVGDTVTLTGYGCTVPGRGTGGNDGIYRVGEAKVTKTPKGKNYDVITDKGAALCFGDSGGPAFKTMPDGTRVLFGVNSRGNIRTTSYLSAVHVEEAVNFMKAWSEKQNSPICGITIDGCGI